MREILRVALAALVDLVLRVLGRTRQPTNFVSALVRSFDVLGGAFLKAGQVLASRPDLLGPEARNAFARLTDNVTPLPADAGRKIVHAALRGRRGIAAVNTVPIASASVAQVYLGSLEGRPSPVVFKVRRPEAVHRFTTDLGIFRFMVRLAASLPWFTPMSLKAAYADIELAVASQLNFTLEATRQRQFAELFESTAGVMIPDVIPDLCGDALITMDHVRDARRIDAPDLDPVIRHEALVNGLRALYAMIFTHGLVHCDLHPGNLLVTEAGSLVILDFGYVADLDDQARINFAQFFLTLAKNDSAGAALHCVETAMFAPPDLDWRRLERDFAALFRSRIHADPADFQVSLFVLGLFEVLRTHQVRATPAFTMAIMALLTFEGLLKRFTPTLEFQREAFPYIMRALRPAASPDVQRWKGSTQMAQITDRPQRIEMAAKPLTGRAAGEVLATLTVDPYENVVKYELADSVASATVDVHGYMPAGWVGERLHSLPVGRRSGSWPYEEDDERNLLAGLAYLTFNLGNNGEGQRPVRAQIEEVGAPDPQFEDFVTVTPMAGGCKAMITIPGVLDSVAMEMEPAQVIIGRSPAVELEDGRRQQELGCAIRVGGARIEGFGQVEVGMFGHENRGWIESMQPDSDFPARMTLDVQKSYITPAGTFYRDKEEFVAENIMRFPPFGVEFEASEPIAPLYEVKSREPVGHVELDWLVPLCYIDPSSFPSKALSRAALRRDEEV